MEFRSLFLPALLAVVSVIPVACDGSHDRPPSSDLPAPVARAIDAIQRGDARLLRALAEVEAVACTHADGAGGPPKCAQADPEGTVYEVFPFLGCQGGWVLSSDLNDLFDDLLPLTGELHAVVRLARGSGGDPHTRGDTLIVFEPADSRRVTQAVGLALAGGRIVRVERGCRTADQMRIHAEGPVAITIDAVQSGDARLLRTLAKAGVVAVACTHADGAGGPPKCAQADPEGTVYEVFPFVGCQGGWVLASELTDLFAHLVLEAGELYAVVRLYQGARGDPYARGDTLIVFEPADSRRVTQAVGLALAGGRFVRVERGCRTADQMLRNPDGTSRELLHSPSPE